MSEADDYEGCGIRPFATGRKDPFFDACSWHDSAYTKLSFQQRELSRKITDLQFYHQMLVIAGDSWKLQARAWIFYRLARLFGARFWEGQK